MSHLPRNASDADLLAFIDDWAALLESENYTAAYEYTDHAPEQGWTPELLRDVVKAYGDAEPNQRVTLLGVPSDVAQRKIVDRWARNPHEIWYDLNINGLASDLTATFHIRQVPEGLQILLNDVHVM